MYRVMRVVREMDSYGEGYYVMEGLSKEQAEELAARLNLIDRQLAKRVGIEIENIVMKQEDTND